MLWNIEKEGADFALRKGRVRMKWVLWLLVILSTSALIILWFWEVRRKLREQHSMVVSARSQMEAFEKRAAAAVSDADVTGVLQRSRSIYHQAAENYNAVLKEPLIYIPGRLMGFAEEPLD